MTDFNPTRYTKPLSEDFPSAIDPFLPALTYIWRMAFGFDLDAWQIHLLRSILEVYPDGHPKAGILRYRQVVISMGRQNGKTEIAAALGLFGLLVKAGALVIGIASSAEQARLVYQRTMQAIRKNPALEKRFDALTDTRGLRAKDGGRYEIKAAKGAALQGLPIDLGICDELHLLSMDLWTSLVNGTGGRDNCIVVGITTAGDENSALLLHLYKEGEAAAQEEDSRFGFFCWEAPEAVVPADDGELAQYLIAANPALSAGRIDMENVISDVRSMPETDVVRYRLNRFTASETVFINQHLWLENARGVDDKFPKDAGRPVISIDRTPDWGFATVVAAVKDEKGITHTEVVASIVKPNLEQLANICVNLSKYSPQVYVMDGFGLKNLGEELKKRGLPVMVATQGDVINASSMVYSKLKQKKIRHAGDPILSLQMPRTIRKNVGDNFRISRKDSSVEIDAVMATVLGIFAAETRTEIPMQVF